MFELTVQLNCEPSDVKYSFCESPPSSVFQLQYRLCSTPWIRLEVSQYISVSPVGR